MNSLHRIFTSPGDAVPIDWIFDAITATTPGEGRRISQNGPYTLSLVAPVDGQPIDLLGNVISLEHLSKADVNATLTPPDANDPAWTPFYENGVPLTITEPRLVSFSYLPANMWVRPVYTLTTGPASLIVRLRR